MFGSLQEKFIDTNSTLYILCSMKTITSIKLDSELKKQASELAALMGVSLSTIVQANLKNFVRERRLILHIEPELNERTKVLYREIKHDLKTGKNISGPFHTVADLKKALLN